MSNEERAIFLFGLSLGCLIFADSPLFLLSIPIAILAYVIGIPYK